MKTYEKLRYMYLSNIACGDIGEIDQAAMLAELEEIKASMQNAANYYLVQGEGVRLDTRHLLGRKSV